MAENSAIEWTMHTFNPWRGCTKVSAGCANCYAETLSGRNPKTLGVWGPQGSRVVAAESQWKLPPKWDAAAKAAGERHRVFCASLADVFEQWDGPMAVANGNPLWWCYGSLSNSPIPKGGMPGSADRLANMDDIRARLLVAIEDTPHLDWLLLTKWPEHVPATLERVQNSCDLAARWCQGIPPPNVWIGVSVENQAAADERVPHLLRTPAAVRFLSCEPLLGPVKITPYLPHKFNREPHCDWCEDCIPVGHGQDWWKLTRADNHGPFVDWVIVGGEVRPVVGSEHRGVDFNDPAALFPPRHGG